MATSRFSPFAGAAFLALTALLAACGGGGGGGGTSGGGGGGGVPPTLSPSNPPPTNPPPTPTATPFSTGQMTVNGAALSYVAFTCGCTQDAGKVNTDASGNYSITVPATSWLGDPKGYTPPGHNLMVIGYAAVPSHVQAWTMEFYGNGPSTDQNLDGSAGPNVADKYTTAAALYVYYETTQYYTTHPPVNNDNTYDIWNFNDIKTLKAHFATNPTPADTNFINGITAAQSGNQSLYPAVPSWDKSSGDGQNNTIVNLIKAMITADGATLPQPCGNSCTGTPAP